MTNLELVEKFMDLSQEIEHITIKCKINNKGYVDDEEYFESLCNEFMNTKREILKRMAGNKK
nr:MAG TPA: hypothetical protein [Caudoviricetes sp.]DAJ89665.1 MAG TPA: hypothetical protein [Caudoviricetes sp.]